MSGPGSQLASAAIGQVSSVTEQRSPLAHLLHALNQPLTALQCSLELAAAGPRAAEYYVRTLNESLELTLRMRLLVEAIRELNDLRVKEHSENAPPENPQEGETFRLDALLRETVDDLRPVAAARSVRFVLSAESPLPWCGGRSRLAQLLFLVLESALALTRPGGEFQVIAHRERQHAVLEMSWSETSPPALSPFSRAELGLLVARAGWEDVGAEWSSFKAEYPQDCTIRLRLALPAAPEPGTFTKNASSQI
jgi:signal transduction histidine kinase